MIKTRDGAEYLAARTRWDLFRPTIRIYFLIFFERQIDKNGLRDVKIYLQ